MTSCDVVVVGGGINGVGVAQAVAAAGHSVVVFERKDLASGTSSRSSKLIHGGLRYLESVQFSLVRESLRERHLLLKLAPDLVWLQRFFIPVYPATRRRPWQLYLGLSLYALLAGLHREARFKRVPKKRWEALDGLTTHGLQAVISYFDAQTDDAALTHAVMRSAQELGAELFAPAEVFRIERHEHGCTVHYQDNGKAHSIDARVVVNAAGPWVAEVANRFEPNLELPPIELLQGTHVLLPGQIERGVYYLENPRDGRAVFVMPRDEGILVGTTERRFRADPDYPHASTAEKHYLFSVLRHYFPRFRALNYDDIIATTAGLRVLPAGRGHAFHRSREVLLPLDQAPRPAVVSVCGGKLTTYRVTAGKVMRRIAPSLPKKSPRADTSRLSLTPV